MCVICICACVCAKSLQWCLTLCNPMDCNLPDSSIHAILQARILQWIAMSSSRKSFVARDRSHVSMSSALAGRFFTTNTTWEAWIPQYVINNNHTLP